jgi:hypothetical protein
VDNLSWGPELNLGPYEKDSRQQRSDSQRSIPTKGGEGGCNMCGAALGARSSAGKRGVGWNVVNCGNYSLQNMNI